MWKQQVCRLIFKKKYMINGEKNEDNVFKGIADDLSNVEKESKIDRIIRKNILAILPGKKNTGKNYKSNKQKYRESLYKLLKSRRFSPAGRTVANARPNGKNKYYNNCYTTPIEDSMKGIYDALKVDALIGQSGGGNGINYTPLRPKDSPLSRGGKASGPVSFMKVFNASGNTIETGGDRRNAKIGMLNIYHPDVEDFIESKRSNKELDQMDLSVVIPNNFMTLVKNNETYIPKFESKRYEKRKAKEVFEKIAKNAYKHNEPGVFFVDRVNEDNNSWEYELGSVNPCGELPLPSSGGVCNLGAFCLLEYVKNPFEENVYFDWKQFKEDIPIAVRTLDNIIDASRYPIENVRKMQKDWRRIGLGFTALADTFVMMNIKYGSKDSIELTKNICKVLRDESYKASAYLAKEKGPFPKYNREKLFDKKNSMVRKLPKDIKELIWKHGLRNIGLNTVAPTGTISIALFDNCSSGIEPIFSTKAVRRILDENREEKEFTMYDRAYMIWKEKFNKSETDEIPDTFVTTLNIDPYECLDVQAVAQEYIDHSISRTINLPIGFSYQKYKKLFMYAYEKGLKGFTTFNPEGSMKGILQHEELEHVTRRKSPKRPKDLECDIHSVTVEGVKYIVIIGKLNGTLYEVFAARDKKGIDLHKYKTGITRKIKKNHYSLLLDNKETVYFDNIVDEMEGKVYEQMMTLLISHLLRCGEILQFIVKTLNKEKHFNGFSKCISRVLKKYIKHGETVASSERCPKCGEKLIFTGGCKQCSKCEWSKCE